MSSHQRTSAELLFLGTDDRRLLFAHAMEGRLGGSAITVAAIATPTPRPPTRVGDG